MLPYVPQVGQSSVHRWAAECSGMGAVLGEEVRNGFGEKTVLGEKKCSGNCSGERGQWPGFWLRTKPYAQRF